MKASVKEGDERGVSGELVCILARVMAQSAASEVTRLSEEGRGGGTRLLVTSVDRLLKRGDWMGSDRGNDIAPEPTVASTWDRDGVPRWYTWDFVPDGLLV